MSWVSYPANHPFPIQNLPWGVFVKDGAAGHACVAIGDFVLDLNVLAGAGYFDNAAVTAALQESTLNTFMSLGKEKWLAVRAKLQQVLSADDATLKDNTELRAAALIPQKDVQMVLPATVGDYTDFYASKEHATNLGKMFRPNGEPLLENWLHIPVGYHGRSSSIVVSGTPLRRPHGQMKLKPDDAEPVYGPSSRVDFELEMAAWVGPGNKMGDRITVDEAKDQIFGLSLFNDWSARDLQKWEYVPLGPFLGKNFGSTISPWIVSSAALEPFLVDGPKPEKPILDYLKQSTAGNYDIALTVTITTKEGESVIVSNSNYKYMYWSFAQMLAHHSVNGCNMRPGDVLASGTISGPTDGSYGSMVELAWMGTKPIKFPSGAERRMIADGDHVALGGQCTGDGYVIGFGECTSEVLPAQ